MKPEDKIRAATDAELAEMPKSLFHAYKQGRLVVKALKTYVFHIVSPTSPGGESTHRLEPGDYWSFWRPFWKADELVVLTPKYQWYLDRATESKKATA
jgi:hypothetical protein